MIATKTRLHLALLALALAPSIVVAQSAARPDAVSMLTPDRLRAIGDSLPHGPSRTAQLGKGAGYTYALTQRERDGGVELHEHWTDVFIVERGAATLVTGPGTDGARESSPGEWRGGTIRDAQRRELHPGDLVVIPAGTAHQMLVPADRVTYLAFKIAVPADVHR